jgi:dTDP-4-dehydrorhamnose 3,5-epimerase
MRSDGGWMKVVPTEIPDLLILEPTVFGDARGFFIESFNAHVFEKATGVRTTFVQDNHSRSTCGVLRGMHYQIQHPQGKIVRVIGGKVWDVAVDLRRSSPTFKKWVGVWLTDENKRMLWIPPGFGHGFLVFSPSVDLLYKATAFYDATADRALRWDDATIGIRWPLEELGQTPILSTKDLNAASFAKAELFD